MSALDKFLALSPASQARDPHTKRWVSTGHSQHAGGSEYDSRHVAEDFVREPTVGHVKGLLAGTGIQGGSVSKVKYGVRVQPGLMGKPEASISSIDKAARLGRAKTRSVLEEHYTVHQRTDGTFLVMAHGSVAPPQKAARKIRFQKPPPPETKEQQRARIQKLMQENP